MPQNWLGRGSALTSERTKERSKAEKRWQAQAEELARVLGWFPFHLQNPIGSPAGMPDLILFRERIVWIELKAYSDKTGKAGRLEGVQERFHDMLREAGQEVHTLWNDEDGLNELKRILARPGVPQ